MAVDYSISFDKLSPLAGIGQHTQSANGLTPNHPGKVLWSKLIGTRRRPTGLPHWLTNHPVADNLCDFRMDNGIGSRSAESQTFIQLFGSLLARREGMGVGWMEG